VKAVPSGTACHSQIRSSFVPGALVSSGQACHSSGRCSDQDVRMRCWLSAGDDLNFVTADLLSDAGWSKAVCGCDYVLHVASPFPVDAPKHEDDLVSPADRSFLKWHATDGLYSLRGTMSSIVTAQRTFGFGPWTARTVSKLSPMR